MEERALFLQLSEHTINVYYNTMANTNTSDTEPSKTFTSTCDTYFQHIPYPCQSAIGNGDINSLLSPTYPIKQLFILPTGGDNTLLFTTIDAALKGVTIYILPRFFLLVLTNPKIPIKELFLEAWLTSFHLDELDPSSKCYTHMAQFLSSSP